LEARDFRGCGNQLRRVGQLSGYQYFATHKWRNQSS
jgi:hypothetical protein